MSYAANAVREKTTYENMDVIYASLAHDPNAQAVLLTLWRRQVWGFATHEHLARVVALVPELWRDLVPVTVPTIVVLNRWERDHGYVSR